LEEEDMDIQIVKALRESLELLRTENTRQRKLIGRLRKTVSDLRRLKNIQIQNDEAFRDMCQSDIEIVMDGENNGVQG
jgi:hypothetical protein